MTSRCKLKRIHAQSSMGYNTQQDWVERTKRILSDANFERDDEIDRARTRLVNMWTQYLTLVEKDDTTHSDKRLEFPIREAHKVRYGIFEPEKVYNGGFTCLVDKDGHVFLATCIIDDKGVFDRLSVSGRYINEGIVRRISQENAQAFLSQVVVA